MLISSTATADRHPVVVDDVTYFKSEWMKAGDDPAFSPTVFLVEQPPNVSLCTHFHRNNQFHSLCVAAVPWARIPWPP